MQTLRTDLARDELSHTAIGHLLLTLAPRRANHAESALDAANASS
jgi:hypothetical protein